MYKVSQNNCIVARLGNHNQWQINILSSPVTTNYLRHVQTFYQCMKRVSCSTTNKHFSSQEAIACIKQFFKIRMSASNNFFVPKQKIHIVLDCIQNYIAASKIIQQHYSCTHYSNIQNILFKSCYSHNLYQNRNLHLFFKYSNKVKLI